MGAIVFADGRAWREQDENVAALLAEARASARSPDAQAVLAAADADGALRIAGDASGRPVALSLRVAIGVICARVLDTGARGPEARSQRDRLYELDQLLQPVIAPKRGRYPTFPSRRHHEQLASRGIDRASVARLIGLSFDEAKGEAKQLGLRLSTAYMLLNRAERQLDVLADDGDVTNILGLHI